jgi:hypothetical protein
MKFTNGIMIGVMALLAVLAALAGCAGAGAPAASTGGTPAPASAGGAAGAAAEYTSAALPASYENALPASTQLALGIFRLEGTPNAITPAQAKTLLPLWEAFEGNALENQTEQNAVLRQIEGTLTTDQVGAIAALKLTNDDLRSWMEGQGMQAGPPGAAGTPGPGGARPEMTDAQRQAFQATRQAGGGAPDFGNMTDAQRQAFRATAEAGGGRFFQRGQGGQGGQGAGARGTPNPNRPAGQFRMFTSVRIFVAPLVELLSARISP